MLALRTPLLLLSAFLSLLPLCIHAQKEVSKPVIAHFMVGNTYPYTQDDWRRADGGAAGDMTLASSKGIDGFALNMGSDAWQPGRIADAYSVAKSMGSNFVLFLSFDMGTIPCQAESDGDLLRTMVNRYHDHSNQMAYKGAPVVTTFGGQKCFFGQRMVNEGWNKIMKTDMPSTHFIASFFMDPAIYGSMSATDGAFSWDSAWPMGNYDIDDSYDREFRRYLDGKTYMAGVSPWFFTHYSPESYNKNWIFRSDDWLLAARWEILVRDRDQIDIVQVITWNDYGESHYMGPISGAQPGSESWTSGFDHQGWLDLQAYYIQAYKTGNFPSIDRDRIFLWGRLFPANADTPDPVGKPLNYEWTQDYVWGVVLLKSPGQMRLSCGDEKLSAELSEGLSKVRLPLTNNCTVTASIHRNGSIMQFSPPGYTFSTNPSMYNFNAIVAASP